MAHEIAKLLLEHSRTFLERAEAVKSAMGLGMPLNEIEAYLDWLEMARSRHAEELCEGDSDDESARDPSR
jgi:hypothetical protein